MSPIEEKMSGGKKSKETIKTYAYMVQRFCDSVKITPEKLAKLSKEKIEDIVIDFIRKNRNKVSASTLDQYCKGIRYWLLRNRVNTVDWSYIREEIPEPAPSEDRAIRLEELQQLFKHADDITRPLVATLSSAGLRVGAISTMRVKHVSPVKIGGKIVCGRLVVYPDSRTDMYVAYCSLEAYELIQSMLRKRGDVKADDPLFCAHGVKSTINPASAKTLISRLMIKAGLRKTAKDKRMGYRHELMVTHCFRKFYKTTMEQYAKPLAIETLMGHKSGLERKYYKPEESDLLKEYLQGMPYLSIQAVYKMGIQAPAIKQNIEEFQAFKEEATQSTAALNTKLSDAVETINKLQEQIKKLQETKH